MCFQLQRRDLAAFQLDPAEDEPLFVVGHGQRGSQRGGRQQHGGDLGLQVRTAEPFGIEAAGLRPRFQSAARVARQHSPDIALNRAHEEGV